MAESGDRRLEADFLTEEDLDEATVEAVGKLSEARETVEVARGHLYAFHQLSGNADFQLGEAVEALDSAGHSAFAEELRRELLGRNVLPGRWTFQVIEEYATTYYAPFCAFDDRGRALTHGFPHVHEARLKFRRRTPGEPGHEKTGSDV